MTTSEETLAALVDALDGMPSMTRIVAASIDAHIRAVLREHLASPPPAGREDAISDGVHPSVADSRRYSARLREQLLVT